MAFGLLLEFFEHTTIVASGPIFLLNGILLLLLALRRLDVLLFLYGITAPAFAFLVVFLVDHYSWTPTQSNGPITILMLVYTAIALPTTYWLYSRSIPSRMVTQ